MSQRRSPSRPLQAGERRRTFTDHEGVFWDVREVRNPDYDRRGGYCLIFESAGGFRRVREYPPDWASRTDRELVTISQGK